MIRITFDHVSKLYRLGQPGYRTLREDVTSRWRSLLFLAARHAERRELWAVRDVSFEVREGETVGLIGVNGAGKSTLLKLVARITRPSEGSITLRGRTASLLELGAGLHPELTGRENIFLYGAIMGLRRNEIRARFDEIVEFAGLADFLDTPLKRYSSGMTMRLGFSVAAHVRPDILLVDEVLTVGDAFFQQKCMQRIEEFRASGGTILLVSHNRHMIERLCGRAVLLSKGQVLHEGDTLTTLKAYYDAAAAGAQRPGDSSAAPIIITGVALSSGDGREERLFHPMDAARIRISYRVNEPVQNPVFYCRLYRGLDLVHGTNTARFGFTPSCKPGTDGVLDVEFNALALMRGVYHVNVGILRDVGVNVGLQIDTVASDAYDEWPHALEFTMDSPIEQGAGLAYLEHRWTETP